MTRGAAPAAIAGQSGGATKRSGMRKNAAEDDQLAFGSL